MYLPRKERKRFLSVMGMDKLMEAKTEADILLENNKNNMKRE
jgi:hypothetical protein